jgi:flagellar basal body rod protein FlgG
MTDLYQLANIGLVDGRQRLEAVSLNAANASLPGYRRHVVASRSFDTALAATDAPVRTLSAQVNVHPGALMATGRALDVAIEPDDLFFALTDGTQTWLTRGGAFHVNNDGVLVGERGLRVVGAQGDITLPSSDVTVETDGRITHEGVAVANLRLFRAGEGTSLIPAEGALLVASDGTQPVDASTVRVRGGTLEASNTDASREMLNLMTVQRQFESLSRIIQGYDAALSRVIEKLGEG